MNVRSLCAATRLLDLELLCATEDIDVLCVTETWLSSSSAAALLNLPGFQPPVRCDRSNLRGGGVAVYVRCGLPAVQVDFHSQLEAVCIQLRLPRRRTVYIVTVYRPPRGPLTVPEFVSFLESSLESLHRSSTSTVCLVGDFNAKSSLWWSGQSTNEPGEQLFNFAVANGFAQIIEGPTRDVGGPTAAQLDLMFIDNVELVDSFAVLSPVADHCPTVMHLCLSRRREPTVQYTLRNFELGDLPGLVAFLHDVDWSPVYSALDPEVALGKWYDIFLSAVSSFVPETTVTSRPNNKPWYSSHLHRLRRQRDRLFNRCKGLSSEHRVSALYRKVRNWYVSELRHAERVYYQHMCCQLSQCELRKHPRRWWSAAKAACGLQSRDRIPPLKDNGVIHLSAGDKASCLNAAFASQCSASPATSKPDLEDQSTAMFSFVPVEITAVLEHLSVLPLCKAPGLDGICHRLLKGCADSIAAPLCHVFNLSLSQGRFPSVWKRAVITPIYKGKADRCDAKSYRLIALLSTVSKLLEAFVRKQLLHHCLANNIIPDEQYGFLPKRSVVWQLLAVLDEWEKAFDEGRHVHACFLDIAKAFDRVDHGLLLHKLASMGVNGAELAWFESYLCGRSICTAVDGVRSSMSPISSGVPQGSVLGPLLFVLYFADLPAVVKTKCALFADDSLVYDTNCSGDSLAPCCQLQDDLNEVQSWADTWASKFNAEKSAHVRFSKRQLASESPQLCLSSAAIPAKDSVKHLGVCLTSSLWWSAHVKMVMQQTSCKMSALKRLAYRVVGSNDFIKQLYLVVVRPTLEHACAAWSNCLKADSMALERVQLSVARAVLRLPRRVYSNNFVLGSIGWPTLAWRRRRFQLLLLWRLYHGQGPPCLQDSLPPPAIARCPYSFRNPLSLAFPSCSSVRRLKSFLPASVSLWNTLPPAITSAASSSSFLRHLDAHFSSDKFSLGLP